MDLLRLLICALLFAVNVVCHPGTSVASEREFSVGYSHSIIADPIEGQMHFSLWYPTAVPDATVRLGPLEFPGTPDAEPAEGTFGVVVLSHGSGESELGHWDTARALAEAGFIAAAVRHPRNNARNNLYDDHRMVLDGRPLQLSAVLDALFADETWSGRIDPTRIAAFGYSAGGYTVLAALGADRDYTRTLEHCARHAGKDPYCDIINGAGRAERVTAYAAPAQSAYDARLCAAVIVDPLTTPFSDAALQAMPPVDLLFFRPEVDDTLKAAFHASRVIEILRKRDDFPEPVEVVVPRAIHYSFLAPVPEVIAKRIPEIAFDPEGFDRAAFHEEMNATIVEFLRQALADCDNE